MTEADKRRAATVTPEEQLHSRILQNFKSVRAFANEIGLPCSTVDSMLRKGVACSSYATVRKICQGLGMDMNLLGQPTDSLHKEVTGLISQAEREHIRQYRALDRHGKKAVDCLLAIEWERMRQRQPEYTEVLPVAARSGKAAGAELTIQRNFSNEELEEEGTEF